MTGAWLGLAADFVRENVLPPSLRGSCLPPILTLGVLLVSQHGTQEAASTVRAMYPFYLPKLGSKSQQLSFLSSRASRRQEVRLQGRPGTGEMTRERRNRDFKHRSQRKRQSGPCCQQSACPKGVCERLTAAERPRAGFCGGARACPAPSSRAPGRGSLGLSRAEHKS